MTFADYSRIRIPSNHCIISAAFIIFHRFCSCKSTHAYYHLNTWSCVQWARLIFIKHEKMMTTNLNALTDEWCYTHLFRVTNWQLMYTDSRYVDIGLLSVVQCLPYMLNLWLWSTTFAQLTDFNYILGSHWNSTPAYHSK